MQKKLPDFTLDFLSATLGVDKPFEFPFSLPLTWLPFVCPFEPFVFCLLKFALRTGVAVGVDSIDLGSSAIFSIMGVGSANLTCGVAGCGVGLTKCMTVELECVVCSLVLFKDDIIEATDEDELEVIEADEAVADGVDSLSVGVIGMFVFSLLLSPWVKYLF